MKDRKENVTKIIQGNGAEFLFFDNSLKAPHLAAHYNLDGSLGMASIINRRFYNMAINPTQGNFNLYRTNSHSHIYLGEITEDVNKLVLRTAIYSSDPKDIVVYVYHRAEILHIIEEVNHGKQYRHFRVPSFLNLQNVAEIQRILDETPFKKIKQKNLHLPD